MTTKDLIAVLKEMHKEIELEWNRNDKKQREAVDEIIQKLREYNDFKNLVLKLAPVLREIGEFLGVYWDDE